MIKLSRPYIPETAIDRVVEVLRSGNLVQGQYVLKFEEELKRYLQVEHVIVVSSGTAALHLALLAIGVGPGDEIIVPSFTFPATANVVELVGAKPVLVDIGLDDFCMETSRIEAAINQNTKGIMPVHEFGQAANMKVIQTLARNYNIPIIEDAACALGTEYESIKAGTMGLMGCYSFHPRKAVTTGEGGAVVTNDPALAAKLRSLRNHGIEVVDDKIQFNYAGLNYRLTDFQAALGYYQFLEIDKLLAQRLRIAGWYDTHLSGLSNIQIPSHFPERRHVYQSYHILLEDTLSRDEVKNALFSADIETNYGANALSLLNFYRLKYGFSKDEFPNSCKAFRQGLALPLSHGMTEEVVVAVCNQLKSILSYGGSN